MPNIKEALGDHTDIVLGLTSNVSSFGERQSMCLCVVVKCYPGPSDASNDIPKQYQKALDRDWFRCAELATHTLWV